MAWTYAQSTGNLTDPNGDFAGTGYSGNSQGLNNPAMQNVHNEGPIPQGQWTIGAFFDDPVPTPPDGLVHKGPVVTHLTPNAGTQTFTRSGFMIHGDNAAMNHTASDGCIILSNSLRQQIRASLDNTLNVV